MVTTKRTENTTSSFYSQSSATSVGLLDRTAPANYGEYVNSTVTKEESLDETKARMRRNLDLLLNYDKATARAAVLTEEKVEEAQEVKAEASLQEDDIRPTLTTMQFGDAQIDQVRAEMRTEEKERKQYRLSGKGKMAIVLYALTVVVVLALIILNTGVLSSLNKKNLESLTTVGQLEAEIESLNAEINTYDDAFVSKTAEQWGMVRG